MKNQLTLRWCVSATLCATLVFCARSAHAQFQPRPLNDPATGETYWVEGAANLWFPTADLSVASEALGQTPTLIDLKSDLGLQDQPMAELRLVLRPSSGNKFRLSFIPIKFTQTAVPPRPLVFNGQRFQNVPVTSTFEWKAYRFAYEYDFIRMNRGFGGFIVEAKYTDVRTELQTQLTDEFSHVEAPIPALGGIGRYYPLPNVSATVEVTGFKLPEHLIKGDQAHYVDFDIYGTLNFTNNIGVQGGYRSLDLGYVLKSDTGAYTLKGMYIGVVARY